MRSAKTGPVLAKLQGLAKGVVDEIFTLKNPSVAVPTRALSNVKFNEKKSIIELGNEKQKRYFFNVGQARKFMQTFLIASACKTLMGQRKTTSIRDLYYMTKHSMGDSNQNTFDEQEESDPVIEDLEVIVNALREELNLFASNRGALVGNITMVDSGDTINCRRLGSGGWSIPSIVEEDVVKIKDSAAKFILMVEKDAVWRRLNEDKFWSQYNCILIHGQGMAPRGVRRLLHRLVSELKIPLYVFVDNDPWGFYIYSVIKQGSINLAYESMRMAVPSAKFIGLSSFDREKYSLPANVTIKLDDTDRNRAKQILEYPWFQKKDWQRELHHMLKSDVKLELEALSHKGISFVSEKYLPEKLKNKEWLD
ncbi:MAG: DNA topoisomerase IV subunit A [Planctomycetota bacterium]|nr:DNA topoisomerase IV subunit A [Planctomycetota bacterium]